MLFDFLEPLVKGQEETNTFLALQRRYNRVRQTRLRGIENKENLTIAINQIASDLLEIIQECFKSEAS
jgi:hypothetical protein